jgi:hypothetical protein
MQPRVRVLVRTTDGTLTLTDDRTIEPHVTVLFGREGDVGVGTKPVDGKVSRQAVYVTRSQHGWAVTATNRNGVIVHPWGQAAGPAEPVCLLPWSHVALRVVGSVELQHWVVLEDPTLAPQPPKRAPGTQLTDSVSRPRPLTWPQEYAIRSLFGPLLAWPPVIPAVPLQIKQVARELNTTKESIQRRLEEVRKKAAAVGMSRVATLTDPEYVYVLVRAGFLRPTEEDMHPLLRSAPSTS